MNYPFYLSVGQRMYIEWLRRFKIRDEAGAVYAYEPMNYQIYLHADCILCNESPPDRMMSKSRKTGATLDFQLDRLCIGLKLPGVWLPFSSITKEVGRTPLEWLKILCDNAEVPYVEQKVPIAQVRTTKVNRRYDLVSRVVLQDNGSEFFEIPGNNPDAMRSFGTVSVLNDEFGRCKYPKSLHQATRGTLVARKMYDEWKPSWQHDIATTMPDDAGHYYNELYDEAATINEHVPGVKKGWKIYHQEMFPPLFFDIEKQTFPRNPDDIGNYEICQLDEEFYYAYNDGDLKRTREICDEAWNAGLWELWQVKEEEKEDLKHLKYYGLWPEDRGIVPLAPWFPLELREADRPQKLIFMREYMASREAARGSLLPMNIIDACAVLPVRHKSPGVWAYEMKGDPRHAYYLGVDFGGTGVVQSHNAGFCVSKLVEPFKMLQVYVQLIDRIDTLRQFEKIKFLCRVFPTIRWVGIDYTGAGRGLGDLCAQPGAITKNVVLLDMGRLKPQFVGIQNARGSEERLFSEGTQVNVNLKWQMADRLKLLAWFGNCEFLNDMVVKRDLNMPDEGTLASRRDPKTGSHAEIFSSTMISFYLPFITGYPVPELGVVKDTERSHKKMAMREQARKIAESMGVPVASEKAYKRVRSQ